jgi:nitric-oxide synthase, bacterial
VSGPRSARKSHQPVTPHPARRNRPRLAAAATAFLSDPELEGDRPARVTAALQEIAATGTYTHTREELIRGARLAWRNHARCIGRLHWPSLHILDRRECTTATQIAAACVDHLRWSTNGGAIRPAITIFPPAAPDGTGTRIWNPQLIRYAGYRHPDGTTTGDPQNTDLTNHAQRLGWSGPGSPFDILPLIIQTPGNDPQLFDIPADAILEIPLHHPRLNWFADLKLRWHALPAVSNMALHIGGITYPAAPFSGWYLDAEIAARNLSDTTRYNLLPRIATRMGLDTTTPRTQWPDRAMLELNQAVLDSYRAAGVRIVDHHTAPRQFITHVTREHHAGRPTPTDWAWVVPPISASTAPTYHRSFDPPNFTTTPNFTYQPDPWTPPGTTNPTPHALTPGRTYQCPHNQPNKPTRQHPAANTNGTSHAEPQTDAASWHRPREAAEAADVFMTDTDGDGRGHPPGHRPAAG